MSQSTIYNADLLWTNSDPTNSFNPTTLDLHCDLTQYHHLEIALRPLRTNTTFQESFQIYPNKSTNNCVKFIIMNANVDNVYAQTRRRVFTINGSNLVIGDAYQKNSNANSAGTVNNNILIPISIWGIRYTTKIKNNWTLIYQNPDASQTVNQTPLIEVDLTKYTQLLFVAINYSSSGAVTSTTVKSTFLIDRRTVKSDTNIVLNRFGYFGTNVISLCSRFITINDTGINCTEQGAEKIYNSQTIQYQTNSLIPYQIYAR